MKSMAFGLAFLPFLAIGLSSIANADDQIKSVVTKQDFALNGFEQKASLCFDMDTKQQIPAGDDDCRPTGDYSQRICKVLVYNLNDAAPAQTVSRGTVFQVTEQLGPKRFHDWTKDTVVFKISSNLTGSEKTSNPNLIIDCSQTKEGVFGLFGGPEDFSIQEITEVLSSVLEIQQ